MLGDFACMPDRETAAAKRAHDLVEPASTEAQAFRSLRRLCPPKPTASCALRRFSALGGGGRPPPLPRRRGGGFPTCRPLHRAASSLGRPFPAPFRSPRAPARSAPQA